MTYEYECKSCSHEWEEEQRITDKPLEKCPECGGCDVHRKIVAAAFVLHGTGWARDGYS